MDPLAILLNASIFVVGVALLVYGGDSLVRGAVAIATRLGVAPVVIGLTAVAFGTSAPELALNLVAAVNDRPGLSFGNIVGSNIANVGLIVGVAALFRPMRVRASLIRREMPMMIGASALLIALAYLPPGLERPDADPFAFARFDGVALLLGFAVVFYFMLRLAKKPDDSSVLLADAEQAATTTTRSIRSGVIIFIIGLAMLLVGGKLAETGAVGLAQELGMTDQLIGLTIVALATSLPELATALAAVRRGHTDIAVGNVVGSNLFNILLIMGATASVNPVPLPPLAEASLGVMILLSLLLLPMSRTNDRIISRIEGAVLLSIYAGYLAFETLAAIVAK